MRLQDRGSDPVQQRRAAARPEALSDRLILRRRILARHELIDERIADVAGAWPLTVRSDGGALEVRNRTGVHRMRTDRAERVGMIRRTALTGPIDEVDAISLLHVVVRPSGETGARSHV